MKIIDIFQNETVAQVVIELFEPNILNGQWSPDDKNISRRWKNLGQIISNQINLDAKLVAINAGINDFPSWLGTWQQFQLTYIKNDK